jgi:hypothetical protein
MGVTFCRVDECVGLSFKDRLCRAHYERQRRGADLRRPLRVPLGSWSAVLDAWHAYQDSDPTNDLAFTAARLRAQRAMRAWAFRHDRRRRVVCVPDVAG